MKNSLKLIAATAACGLVFVAPASAGIVYATSFEEPTFVAGPLTGQDSWTATIVGGQPVMTVTAGAQAHLGNQFVLYNARDTQTTVNEVKFNWKPINISATDMLATPILSTTVFTAIQTGSNTDSDLTGLDLYNIAGARIARMDFSSEGVVRLFADSTTPVLTSAAGAISMNAYHKLGMVVNYLTGAVEYSVDNTVVGTSTTLNATTFGDADLFTAHVSDDASSNAGNRIAWDDLVIATAVPEPTTLSLVAVSGLALLRRRRTV